MIKIEIPEKNFKGLLSELKPIFTEITVHQKSKKISAIDCKVIFDYKFYTVGVECLLFNKVVKLCNKYNVNYSIIIDITRFDVRFQ